MPLWSRIVNVFRGDRVSREIDEELQSHIDDARADGRDLAEAKLALGSALRHREASRDVRTFAWIDSLRADAIFGWRRLIKTKVTSGAAIVSLALAIGACTSAFRLVDALLFRPLPISSPERLYIIAFQGMNAQDGKQLTYDSSSYPMFREMRDFIGSDGEFVAASYVERSDLTYGSDQEMEKAYRQFVSGAMFPVFGIQPAAGRLLTANDDVTPGAHHVVVISYDYWNRRFGKDPSAVGRTLRVGDQIFEITGVAAEGFTGTETGTPTDIFFPTAMKDPRTLLSASNFWMRSFVLLKPGVDPAPIEQKLKATFRSIQERAVAAKSLPRSLLDGFLKEQLLLQPAPSGRSNLQRDYKESLFALSLLVALVLLIACANVANLMTARAAARGREMALRVSIGAGRFRLVQLVLIESALIAALSTFLGAVFAWWSAPYIIGLVNSPDNPARLLLPADWRVLGFGLALTLTVTFLFGLFPALRASSVKPSSALKGGDDPHSRRRLMHAMIALQVAFCFLVIFVAGLFVTSFEKLSSQPLGFNPDRIVNLEAVTSTPQSAVYWGQAAENLRRQPGVEAVAMSGWPIMSGETGIANIAINGAVSDVFIDVFGISSNWAATMKVPILSGRDFRENELNPNVAIVNQAFAKQFFENTDPVGKSFETLDNSGARTPIEIIGYIKDARYRDRVRLPIRPMAFRPMPAQRTRAAFVVRTTAPVALLRQQIPFRVTNVRTQVEIVESKTVRERLLALLALFFAVVALLLAGVGLYGVLDYTVLQQRREIGIRLAIGARGLDIAQQVTVPVFSMVLAGGIAGVALGMISVRFVEALLYQSKATDLSILAVPSLAILASTMLAALPAVLRALRVDPVEMLRSE